MNRFYQNYEREVSKNLGIKRARSFAEQMRAVYYSGMIGKIIIHVLSFSAACIYPAYLFEILFGSFYIGLIVGLIGLLIFVEIPKWAAVNTFFENYFHDNQKIISYGIGLFALALMSVSILSSTFGVPILVERLAPDAQVISIDTLESRFDEQAAQASAFYLPQIDDWTERIDAYFNANKKPDKVTGEMRLSTAKRVRQPYNDMLSSKKIAQEQLNERLKEIESLRQKELSDAKSENAQRVSSHKFKKDNAGLISMFIMLFLELTYILIVCGLKYYKNRAELEQKETQQQTQTDNQENVRTETDNENIVRLNTDTNSSEQTQTDSDGQSEQTRNPIRFAQKAHGVAFIPENGYAAQVWYKKQNGQLVSYTASECERLANRKTSSEKFKREMLRLAQIARDYQEQKHSA